MKTCAENRIENLRTLVSEYKSNANLAAKIGKDPAQISQWLNSAKDSKTGRPRSMSDDIARLIEEKTGKPHAWMDNDHSDAGLEGFRRLSPAIRAELMRKGNSDDEQKSDGNRRSASKRARK